jgi:hypothetical protein
VVECPAGLEPAPGTRPALWEGNLERVEQECIDPPGDHIERHAVKVGAINGAKLLFGSA